MALQSNALTSRSALQSYMRSSIMESDLMAIYATGYTTCTVTVDSTNLTITANAVSTALALATYSTIGTLCVAINALAPSQLFARVVGGSTGADSTGLLPVGATNILLVANETYLRGIDYTAVDNAINAASDAFEKYCGAPLVSASYEAFYDGSGRDSIVLKHRPVTTVDRVCLGRRDGLTIYNTLTDCSDATVAVSSTAIVLRIWGGTNSGSDSVTIGSNTLTQLVTAINAVGKGWVGALSDSTAGAWLGTELLKRSPASARNSTRVSLYLPEISDVSYMIEGDGSSGILTRSTDSTMPRWGGWDGNWSSMTYTGAPQSHIAPLVDPGGRTWPVGQFNVYVSYTAGYSSIPSDLAMLCNEAAANILRSGARDMTLRNESMQGYSWNASSAAMSDEVESWFTGSIRRRLKEFGYRNMTAVRYKAA